MRFPMSMKTSFQGKAVARSCLVVFCALVILVLTSPATATESSAERERVYVAAYDYAPYYNSHSGQHFLADLIYGLNGVQDDYEFIIREVRPQDRYSALSAVGCCDLIFFESENWGWQESGYEYYASPGILRGRDRLYSLQNDYWEPRENDRIGGVVGYHYQLTNMVTDSLYSEQEYRMYRANNQQTVLNMLRHGRIQFAMLSEEFVNWLAEEDPEQVDGLYASPYYDDDYQTQIIFSPTSPVSVVQLFRYLDRVAADPYIQAQIRRYQLRLTQFSSVINRES